MKWLLLGIVLLLCSCGIPRTYRISGMVTVIEADVEYQVVSVMPTNANAAVALLVKPPRQWEPQQCYTVTYYDPNTQPDGTLRGEPRALTVADCEE